MLLKRALYFLLVIICIIPMYACNHDMEDDYINLQIPTDSINGIGNPSDSISKPNDTSLFFFKSDTIIVAHWNIGNFALGKSSTTSILAANAKEMGKKYHMFLDTLNIDIMGVCEFDPFFSSGKEKTQEIVFNKFPYNYIGKKYSYNCNAVFSIVKLKNNQEYFFPEYVQTRYYTKTTINVNGENVIFVETHLDWNQGANGAIYRKRQIEKLIEIFRDSTYIILCADFNTTSLEEFQPFIDAGFTLSNGGKQGSLNTYPATNPSSPIDNIIVKGLNVLDVKVVVDDRLSDHALIKSILSLKR